MIKIYVNLIKKGFKTIEDVPTTIREDVLKVLKEDGFYVEKEGDAPDDIEEEETEIQ